MGVTGHQLLKAILLSFLPPDMQHSSSSSSSFSSSSSSSSSFSSSSSSSSSCRTWDSPLSQSACTAAGSGGVDSARFWSPFNIIKSLSCARSSSALCVPLLVLAKNNGPARPCGQTLLFIMREIVHLQAGQCGNQIGAKVRQSKYQE